MFRVSDAFCLAISSLLDEFELVWAGRDYYSLHSYSLEEGNYAG